MAYSVENIVEALYEAGLGRPADAVGKEQYCRLIHDGQKGIVDVAREMFLSAERADQRDQFGMQDHSQFGEFTRILKRLARHGTKHGIIVDVGARGKERSNSFDLLSALNWRGILFEANPALYDQIEADFKQTDFDLVRCAIGATEGTLPFYIGSNDDVSSLLSDHAAGWGDIRGTVIVPVRRLPDALDELAIPKDFDILSLDIEGMDVLVLNDFIESSMYRPQYIIIEASYNFSTKSLAQVGCSSRVCFNYDIIDQTEANLILGRI